MEPYDDILAEAATRFDLDPEVLARYLQAESSGDPNAMSNKGATGLMQLMPATAAEMGYSEEDLLDPYKNIMAGSQYIRKLTDDFTANPVGDIPLEDLVPAGYNSGPVIVRNNAGIHPFE